MEQTHIKKRVKQPAINYACELCEFNTSKKCNYEAHLLTPKHFRLSEATKKGVNEDTKKPLECKDCNYVCFTKYKLDRHLSTPKHKKKVDESTPIKKVYQCVCGKTYKHASSLCKHSHTCNPVIPDVSSQVVEPTADDTISRLVEENRELTKIIIEQTRKFDEMIAKERETINTTTHTTTTETTQNNISVNIRFLLNDKCYDAKQLIEFLTSNNETNITV
jgi:hypothetical protein